MPQSHSIATLGFTSWAASWALSSLLTSKQYFGKKSNWSILSNLKKKSFLVFGLISLTLILFSCFSGVFFTLVNHLITKLSCSWLEHVNGSVRTITLHFRVSWFHDSFLHHSCGIRALRLLSGGLEASPTSTPFVSRPCVSSPCTLCLTEFGSQRLHPFSLPSNCFPPCSWASLTCSYFRLHCVPGKSAFSPPKMDLLIHLMGIRVPIQQGCTES